VAFNPVADPGFDLGGGFNRVGWKIIESVEG